MTQILILAPTPIGRLDHSANEVAGQIAADRDANRDANDVIVVGAIELATASWSHRLTDGAASTTVRLKDGRHIGTDDVGAVLNLIRALPAVGFTRAGE